MTTDRKIAHAPLTRDVAARVAGLGTPCIGCEDCTGVCRTLLDAIVLPDVVLHHRRGAA